jgi:peptidoglycan-associated lipoprotein
MAPPPATAAARPGAAEAPAPPPRRVGDEVPVAEPVLSDETIANRSLDDLNRYSPLAPVYFALDSADLDDAGRAVAAGNAEILKRFPTWKVTIEGHCDERGTAEYNLALGERRALAIRAYLASLGVPPERLRTVSYGEEYPFDPAPTEAAWSKNRRGQFVITAK